MTTYTYRLNALEKPTTLTLEDDALLVEREGRIERILLAGLTESRLSFAPTRADLVRYDCRLTARGGARLLIRSTSWEGFGDFKDQGPEYAAFVRELHARLAGVEGVAFVRGESPARYWGSLGCFAGVMLMLLVVLLGTGLIFVPAVAVIKLVLILVLVPWVWKWGRVNRPGVFDPRGVEGELLPGG